MAFSVPSRPLTASTATKNNNTQFFLLNPTPRDGRCISAVSFFCAAFRDCFSICFQCWNLAAPIHSMPIHEKNFWAITVDSPQVDSSP